jgi:prepilin-type N-terminal cleavage/methylation domain-containing protein
VQIRDPGDTTPARTPAVPSPATGLRQFRPTGFTLIELLVVIGIIALLAAILIPVLSKARVSSRSVNCLSNLRQVMMAFGMYANTYNQRLPNPQVAEESWESLLRDYLPTREIYHCQADGGLFENLRSSYDWRDTSNARTTLAGRSMLEIRRHTLVFAFDALPDWHARGKINAARADGSALTMSYQDCLRDLYHDISLP